MATSWQFECLMGRIDSLEAEIRRVSLKEHPSDGPRVVYDALVAVLKRNKQQLTKQIELFGLLRKRAILDELHERTVADVDKVASVFSLVDRVDSPRIPFEVLRALSWATKELTGLSFCVVFRVDPMINYSILHLSPWFEKYGWGREWQDAKEHNKLIEHDVLLLGVPTVYASSLLLNALAAHEIGHLIFRKNRNELMAIWEPIFRSVRDQHRPQLEDYIAKLSSGERKNISQKESFGRLAPEIARIAKNVAHSWAEETYSDLVGAKLLGPAYVAAFDRVIVGRHGPSQSHPPSDLRREIVRTHFNPVYLRKEEQKIWDSLLDESSSVSWRRDPLWALAADVCHSVADAFNNTLKNLPSPFNIPPDEFHALVSAMQEHIDNLSPPSAAMEGVELPADTTAIWMVFFAAWQYRLDKTRFEGFMTKYGWENNVVDAENVLDNLILQSLQALELKNAWHNRGR